MSTKIYDAWRIPTQSIKDLVALGNALLKLQSDDALLQSYLTQFRNYSWWKETVQELRKIDPEFGVTAYLGNHILPPLLDLNASSPTWAATSRDRTFLSLLLDSELQGANRSERLKPFADMEKNTREMLEQFYIDIFEALNRASSPSVFFLQGDNGSTYLKGFALTDASRQYLDEKYERFEYWDSCEMGATAFSKEVQDKAASIKDEEQRYEYLMTAQTERGELWDQALGDHFSFTNAGLRFPLGSGRPHIYTLIKQVLSEQPV